MDMSNNYNQGTLYLCPTPIGNMGDITLRTLEVLKSVDIIACEDTRQSAKLTSFYEIHTTLTSYHEHNRKSKGEWLLKELLEGKNVAIISDAGMPGISDPGEDMIKLCIENGIEYTVLPGASAGITALIMSGISAKRYVFEGFLSRIPRERKEILNEISNESRTLVFYESPHHLQKILNDLYAVLGLRKMTIIREISKKFEEKIHTDTREAIEIYKEKEPKGEFVLVVEGLSREEKQQKRAEAFENMSLEEHMDIYLSKGMEKKDAMKAVAKDLGITKREVFSKLEERKLKNG